MGLLRAVLFILVIVGAVLGSLAFSVWAFATRVIGWS